MTSEYVAHIPGLVATRILPGGIVETISGGEAELLLFEDLCREWIRHARWPNGVYCPRCGHSHISWLVNQRKYECAKCEYQFSDTSGTFMHKTRVPPHAWVLFWKRLSEGRSIRSAAFEIGVSYPTAHRMAKLIRAEEMSSEKASRLIDEAAYDEPREAFRKNVGALGRKAIPTSQRARRVEAIYRATGCWAG